ncbi:MAG: hypothetical protein ACPHEP_04770 [Acidimicrobiales bacterium]
MVEMVLYSLAVASILVVAFSLWLAITATIGLADVTEQRRLNRLVEAKAREQRRHRRTMRRIRNRRR